MWIMIVFGLSWQRVKKQPKKKEYGKHYSSEQYSSLLILTLYYDKWVKRSYEWSQAPKSGKFASLICECELMVEWPSNSPTRPNFGQPKPTKEKSQSNTGIQWLNNQTDSLTICIPKSQSTKGTKTHEFSKTLYWRTRRWRCRDYAPSFGHCPYTQTKLYHIYLRLSSVLLLVFSSLSLSLQITTNGA